MINLGKYQYDTFMDTGKLLKVIEDIKKDEEEFKFQEKFQRIRDFYGSNNPNGINDEKKAIEIGLGDARLNNYVLTDFKILEGLEIKEFFGEYSWVELNNILSSQAHEVLARITSFVSKRAEVLTKLQQVRVSLALIGLEPRVLDDGEYEIGFSFPEEYQNLKSFEDVLSDMNLLLAAIASATDEKKEFKINYVSNGTIEVFIQATVELAKHFGTVLEYALKIYEAVQMAEALKKGYQHMSRDRLKAVEELAEAEKKEKVENLANEMIGALEIGESEDKVRIGKLFQKLLKHFENGVNAEIKTPEIEKPRETVDADSNETKKELKSRKKEYDAKRLIDVRNKKIFQLQGKFVGLITGFLESGKKDEGIAD